MKDYDAEIARWNVRKKQAKGIPGEFHYSVAAVGAQKLSLAVDVASRGGGTGLRKVDVWLVAMVAKLASIDGGREVSNLRIVLRSSYDVADLESFRRRVSYLALNNGWSIAVETPSGPIALADNWSELFPSKTQDSIHENWRIRKNSADKDGAIEKMLQTWLAGVDRTDNHRLAVLGPDFIYSHGATKVKVQREVPTGSFGGSIAKHSRILPTYWVDLVTVNRSRELAIIELKVSDSKLEVMAQALDYALFFRAYRAKLLPILREKLVPDLKENAKIACYVVNNRFHEHFDAVGQYYQPKATSSACGFRFRKIALGGTTEI